MTIDALNIGESAIVTKVYGDEGMITRLSDLGFVCGTRVVRVMESPLGDPSAYLIRGTVIALRDSDASRVFAHKDEA